jgi:acyl-CoA thioesterase-1
MIRYIVLIVFIVLSNCSDKKSELPKEKPAPIMKGAEIQKIIFFGDSLTAGLGLPGIEYSYPMLIQKKLDADGYKYKVINSGLSGDTTSGGLTRLDWATSKGVDIFILELGANDSMRGIPISTIRDNLTKIIQKVRTINPNVKILLIPMKTFPNMGVRYTEKFEKVYDKVSETENVPVSKFLLDNIAGIKSLNQEDGIHPTVKGHEIMAKNIYPDIVKLLKK